MNNPKSAEDLDLDFLKEAEHALKTVNEAQNVAYRPIIGINYPFFIVFGVAILISYMSGQFLPTSISAFTTGWIWFFLTPVCQFIAFQWYRYESKRYGVVRNDRGMNRQVLIYFGLFSIIGLFITVALILSKNFDLIFPFWMLGTSLIYILWGYKVSAWLMGLGVVTFFMTVVVVLWLMPYSYLILSLTVGGGNVLLGVIAWWQLQRQKNWLRARVEQNNGAEA
jgi:hypothetical protein